MWQRYTLYMMHLLMWPTLFISVSLTSIIWLTQALRFIDFIINRGLSIWDFTYLTMLLVPSLLLLILPISLFVAVIFTYNKLSADSELVVFKAAGLSPLQLARPAIIIALIVTACCYGLSMHLMPLTKRQFKDTQMFLRDNYTSVLLQEEVFNSPVDGLTVFVRHRDEDGTLHGVLVHDNRIREAATTMMAEQAQLVQTPNGPRFYLTKGMRQERRDGRVSWLNFDSYNLDISLYTEQAAERTRGPEEMYMGELLSSDVQDDALHRKYLAEAHQRLTWPMYALGLALLACSVMLRGEFNRRGQWKRVATVSVAAIGFVVTGLGLTNLVVQMPLLTPLLYVAISLLIVSSLIALMGDWRRSVQPTLPEAMTS